MNTVKTQKRNKAVTKSSLSLLFSAVVTASLFTAVAAVWAQSAEQKGYDIAKKSIMQDKGFIDSQSEMTMTLKNANGDVSTREMRFRTMEVKGDGDKSLTIFDKPRDVKGTALLTYSHPTGDDDQWLYLPALKRVKRISSSNKSGPFMGSEFAFEDLGSAELEEYKYKFIKENDLDQFVVEQIPNYAGTGYSKRIAYYDNSNYTIDKIQFYDRKGALLKTLRFQSYKKYKGKFYRAHKMSMVNHQTKKSTTIVWKGYKFGNGYKNNDFNKNALKRFR